MYRLTVFGASLITGFALSVSLTLAENVPAERVNRGWQVNVTPINGLFLWGIHGKLKSPRSRVTSVNLNPFQFASEIVDIVHALQFVALPTIEVRKDKFGATFDLVTMSLQASQPLRGFLFSDLSSGFEMTTASFTGAYRFYESERATFDAVAGARLWNTHFSVSLTPGALLRGGAATVHKRTWIDPVVGVAGRYNLTDNMYLSGYGNVGGVVSSDVTWDVFGKVGYEAGDVIDLFAGFRYFGVKYSDSGAIFNMNIYGPVAGATLKF